MFSRIKNKIKSLYSRTFKALDNDFSDEEYIELLYRLILNRAPDEEGESFYLKVLKEKKLSRREVLRALADSEEFELLCCKSEIDALHRARCKFVRTFPYASVIVDLGGVCESRPEGALYAMGYPYRAKELYIVDLPPQNRLIKSVELPEEPVFEFEGTTIHYIYGTMSDLSFLENDSVEMVFMGESIEHISEEEGYKTFSESFRVLKKGGYLILDTPNRLVTMLQCPDTLINPEHRIEYTPEKMREKIRNKGFTIIREFGISPFLKSLREKKFFKEEFFILNPITDKPEEAYLMGFFCRKD